MRYLGWLGLLAFSALVAACDLQGPDSEIQPVDTIQTRGTLLTSGESVSARARLLVWVPGTELVAFASVDSAGCATKTVDTESGRTGVVDSDCNSLASVGLWWEQGYFRSLVAAPDGEAIYYAVGIGDGHLYADWVLRVADLVGGNTSTLRAGVVPALALSPDGQHLAYLVPTDGTQNDSLIVRDLSTGVETHYSDYGLHEMLSGYGGPIAFSPDGTELLYGNQRGLEDSTLQGLTLRRLSLGDGTGVSIPLTVSFAWGARHIHWGASGLQLLAEQGYPREYDVVNLTTGDSVKVGAIQSGEGYQEFRSSTAWSSDGTLVAYWIYHCIEFASFFDCALARYALYVADTRSGSNVRVAYTSGAGPIVFSPDGTRLLYHDSDGGLYLVELP